jgi:ankyrin repeat protein
MKNGLNVSHIAAVHSNIDTLRVLNQMGANFELLDQEEQTALFYAVKR